MPGCFGCCRHQDDHDARSVGMSWLTEMVSPQHTEQTSSRTRAWRSRKGFEARTACSSKTFFLFSVRPRNTNNACSGYFKSIRTTDSHTRKGGWGPGEGGQSRDVWKKGTNISPDKVTVMRRLSAGGSDRALCCCCCCIRAPWFSTSPCFTLLAIPLSDISSPSPQSRVATICRLHALFPHAGSLNAFDGFRIFPAEYDYGADASFLVFLHGFFLGKALRPGRRRGTGRRRWSRRVCCLP